MIKRNKFLEFIFEPRNIHRLYCQQNESMPANQPISFKRMFPAQSLKREEDRLGIGGTLQRPSLSCES